MLYDLNNEKPEKYVERMLILLPLLDSEELDSEGSILRVWR
jgi:hypothetical protein